MKVASKKNIAAMVIFYNPSVSAIKYVHSYINEVDHLYIVDNSDKPCSDPIINSNKVSYMANNDNLGVAKALNQGANEAINDGYDWLLTMDQDSEVTENMLNAMMNCLNMLDNDIVGIISPRHFIRNKGVSLGNSVMPMTSGCLMNLSAYKKCGGYDEKLFIDHVDHEYCIRLRLCGYKIVLCENALLVHELGDTISYKMFNHRINVIKHSSLRWYYFLRNGILLSRRYVLRYPAYTFYFIMQVSKEVIKILFLYNNKGEYCHMSRKALTDAIKGIYGRCNLSE